MVDNKHKAYLLVLVTFLLGAIVGGSVQYLITKASATPRAKTVSEITDELGLTLRLEAPQKNEIYNILEEAFRQHGETKKEYKSKHESIRNATRGRIGELLNADQKIAFEKWTRELDERRKKAEAEEKK